MSREMCNDPRQILAILNSLGVVGITAAELKQFMKELKLYRKVKDRECQLWKEDVKEKIRQGQYKKQQTNAYKHADKQESTKSYKEKTSDEWDSRQSHREKTRDRKIKDQIVLNKTQLSHECKYKNDKEKQTATLTIDLRSMRHDQTCEKVQEKYEEQQKKNLNRPVSAPDSAEKVEPLRQSRKRSKSATPTDSSKPSTKERCSRSKSFIRSRNRTPESRASLASEKLSNGPVTLYNKYKKVWDQLSLPGENSHAKLRWAVREKMLGSDVVPKPVVQYKRPSRTSSAVGRRK